VGVGVHETRHDHSALGVQALVGLNPAAELSGWTDVDYASIIDGYSAINDDSQLGHRCAPLGAARRGEGQDL
jgi:hypothetical protein